MNSNPPPPPPPANFTQQLSATTSQKTNLSGQNAVPPPPPPPKPLVSGVTTPGVNTTQKTSGQDAKSLEITRILTALKINPLAVLGLPTTATPSEIEVKYRRISLIIHPDKCPSHLLIDAKKAFSLLNTSRQIFQNDETKKKFNGQIKLANTKVVAEKKKHIIKEMESKGLPIDDSKIEADIKQDPLYESLVFKELNDILIEEDWLKNLATKEHSNAEKQAHEDRLKRKAEEDSATLHEQAWEEGRDDRVSNWRKFTSKKKNKSYRPPSSRGEIESYKPVTKPPPRV